LGEETYRRIRAVFISSGVVIAIVCVARTQAQLRSPSTVFGVFIHVVGVVIVVLGSPTFR
jgi:hypothetical protein